jgi:hypothetical protein
MDQNHKDHITANLTELGKAMLWIFSSRTDTGTSYMVFTVFLKNH